LGEFTTLAEAGDSSAMYDLGEMYVNGRGVPVDFRLARDWYEKAATAGNANAMFQLVAVAQDRESARRWLEKAAAAGVTAAMNQVARMLERGEGVARDVPTARRWREKAAAAGDDEARTWLRQHAQTDRAAAGTGVSPVSTASPPPRHKAAIPRLSPRSCRA
jgi:TPR repeat protein